MDTRDTPLVELRKYIALRMENSIGGDASVLVPHVFYSHDHPTNICVSRRWTVAVTSSITARRSWGLVPAYVL